MHNIFYGLCRREKDVLWGENQLGRKKHKSRRIVWRQDNKILSQPFLTSLFIFIVWKQQQQKKRHVCFPKTKRKTPDEKIVAAFEGWDVWRVSTANRLVWWASRRICTWRWEALARCFNRLLRWCWEVLLILRIFIRGFVHETVESFNAPATSIRCSLQEQLNYFNTNAAMHEIES